MAFDIIGAKQAGATDEEIAAYLSQKVGFRYDDAIAAGASPQEIIGHLSQKPEIDIAGREKSGALRRAADYGVTALKGAIGLPEAFVGLADIPTGGRVGKALESVGYRPAEAREILDTLYSPEQQEANRRVAEADGFIDTVQTAAENPSTIAHAVVESAPSMVGGAGIARNLLARGVTALPVVAGAIGEGAIAAGSAAEQIRGTNEDRLLTPKQSAIALAGGAATGGLGLAGGKFAQKLGISDVDTILASGKLSTSQQGVIRRVAEGAFSEGILEELPQSAQEQVAQNLATNRPWNEGVAESAAMGMLAGGVMGGGSQILAGKPAVDANTDTVDLTTGTAVAPPLPDDPAATDMAARVQERVDVAAEPEPGTVNGVLDALNNPQTAPVKPNQTVNASDPSATPTVGPAEPPVTGGEVAPPPPPLSIHEQIVAADELLTQRTAELTQLHQQASMAETPEEAKGLKAKIQLATLRQKSAEKALTMLADQLPAQEAASGTTEEGPQAQGDNDGQEPGGVGQAPAAEAVPEVSGMDGQQGDGVPVVLDGGLTANEVIDEPNAQAAVPQEPAVRQDMPEPRGVSVVQGEPDVPGPQAPAGGTGAVAGVQPAIPGTDSGNTAAGAVEGGEASEGVRQGGQDAQGNAAERDDAQGREEGQVSQKGVTPLPETASAPRPPASLDEMVQEAARWKGAATKVSASLGDDKKAQVRHNKLTTKGDLDAYLMRKFGVDDVTARDVSNALTAQNIPADKTADIQDFASEPWAAPAQETPIPSTRPADVPTEVKGPDYQGAVFQATKTGKKRGGQDLYLPRLNDSRRLTLEEMRLAVSEGEAGGRNFIDNANEPGQTVIGYGSSFPGYFSGKGHKKADALAAITKALSGEGVTEKQLAMLDDMAGELRRQQTNAALKMRAEARAETIRAALPELSDATVDDLALTLETAIEDNPSPEALNELFDFFETVGMESTEGAPAEEAPAPAEDGEASPAPVETDDAGGWKQAVAVKGEAKAPTIGGVQKQGGKRVGTADLMDGFTPEPAGLFDASRSEPAQPRSPFTPLEQAQQDLTDLETQLAETTDPEERAELQESVDEARERVRQEKVKAKRVAEAGATLYSGIDPVMIVQELAKLTQNVKAAIPKLVELGKDIMARGAATYKQFAIAMKHRLGALYDSFKGVMVQVYQKAKAANEKLGERGAVDLSGLRASLPKGDLLEKFYAKTGAAVVARAGQGSKAAAAVVDAYASTMRLVHHFSALGSLANKEKFLNLRDLAHGTLDEINATVERIYKTLSMAHETGDMDALYNYFTSNDFDVNSIKHPEVRRTAQSVKQQIITIGDMLVEKGWLKPETHEETAGTYLPRVYLKHLLGTDTFAKWAGGKKLDRGYLKARKDIPEEVRRIVLGEVTDAAYLAARAVSLPLRDLAIAEWLETVASDTENGWVLPKSLVAWSFPEGSKARKVTPYWLKGEASRLREQSRHMPETDAQEARELADRMDDAANGALEEAGLDPADIDNVPKGYKKLPNSPRYGALRGLVVRREIYNDIVGVGDIQLGESDAWRAVVGGAMKATALWKFAKVALNPPTQAVNFVTNMILLHLSGVPFHRVPQRMLQAAREIRADGPHWQVAKRRGVRGATFANTEMGRVEGDLKVRLKRDPSQASWRYAVGKLLAFAKEWGYHKPGDVYQFMEAVGKTAKIIDMMEREGADEATAARAAHDTLYDYSLVPAFVRSMRIAPIGAPFITFAFKSIPAMAKVAATRPWRFAPYYTLMVAMNAMAMAANGDLDDDDLEKIKKSLPEWIREKGHTVLLPWKDQHGRWQVFDFGKFLPWTPALEIGKGLVSGDLTAATKAVSAGSGLIPDLLVAWKTKADPFTKKPIVPEVNPTATETATGWLWFLQRLSFPSVLTDRGTVGKIVSAYTEKPDRWGEAKVTPMQAAASVAGVNIYSADPAKTRAQNLERMRYEITALKRELTQRFKENPDMSPAKRLDVLREQQEKIRDVQQRMREYGEETALD